jgi:hypothetical protein
MQLVQRGSARARYEQNVDANTCSTLVHCEALLLLHSGDTAVPIFYCKVVNLLLQANSDVHK